MPFADTDFFIAMMREGDRHGSAAKAAYGRYEGAIYTSFAVAIELLLVGKRLGMDAREMVSNLVAISSIIGISTKTLTLAARYIEEQGLGIFDAFHAAMCNGEIISSDHVFKNLGIKTLMG